MDTSFWIERWQKGDIGFHRDAAHPALDAHWAKLDISSSSTVFVPLCGKSLDMEWLARRGHRVLGIELSQLAIDAFFKGQGLEPTVRQEGSFAIKSAGPYELWCGDIFELPPAALAEIAAVYDRASLVAFPPQRQGDYIHWLATSLPEVPMLLVSLGYDENEMNGPPFSIPEKRLRELAKGHLSLKVLSQYGAIEDNPGLRKRGLNSLEETVYLAQRSQ
jgi:thiopurine S-methyltransferase